MDKKTIPFIKFPQKFLELGLNHYEIAVLVCLLSHRDPSNKNEIKVFPSLIRLAQMTDMSRTKVWMSLKVLSQCNIVKWDSGFTGFSNRYEITPSYHWIKKVK